MFIHTLTFLNISERSPSKAYLAYVMPNLCFIIQSSCTHISLKMQYMNCASLLHTLSNLLFHCMSLPHFHYLCFDSSFFFVVVVVFFLQSPCLSIPPGFPISPLTSLSLSSPCLCILMPKGSLLISAVTLSLLLHLKLTLQLCFVNFS